MARPAAEYLARKASEALQTDLDALESNLHNRLQTTITAKFDLMKWILLALIAQGGFVVGLVKLL